MPFDRNGDRLEDIREAIHLAQQFIADRSFEQFQRDTMCVFAVIRCLEIISEASRKADQGFKDRYPQLPWPQIAAAGNVYRHEYPAVRADVVWNTVVSALPPLLSAIEAERGPSS